MKEQRAFWEAQDSHSCPTFHSLLQIFPDQSRVPEMSRCSSGSRTSGSTQGLMSGRKPLMRRCLVLDLRVHSKVGHQMDVANSVTGRGNNRN